MTEIVADWGTTLSRLFVYPDAELRERLAAARALLIQMAPDAVEGLDRFAEATAGLSLTEQEELFTRTFDFDPDTALEIGWHLFGEDYNRGALLVRLRGELRRHGIDENGELPDHLTLVLPLLERMEPEEAQTFFQCCVAPALSALLQGLQRKQSPYQYLVQCLLIVLENELGDRMEEEAHHA